jgi:hypothetical protein
MHFGRPEVWMLATVFAIAGLVLAFGHIAEELLEGDATKFDQTILLFFRNANDLSDPIGAPWVEEMARTLRLWVVMPFSASSFAVVIYLFMARQRAAAFWVLAAVGGGVLLSNVLKLAFERPRPDLVAPRGARLHHKLSGGHATLSAITYLTLGALLASLHGSRGSGSIFWAWQSCLRLRSASAAFISASTIQPMCSPVGASALHGPHFVGVSSTGSKVEARSRHLAANTFSNSRSCPLVRP